ncbi:hypothetical protein WME76_12360 [Sorangium sp. So ce119]|uniref:hypothetical protein n=1 Tax=Sorangium sp. So ce119 TaxID=3133279 RepID=UPI003F602A2B
MTGSPRICGSGTRSTSIGWYPSSITASTTGWTARVDELRRLARDGDVSLARFLEETGPELEDVVAGQRSWSDLRGEASYVRHEGELPMAITWRLHHALPGDLFASFAAAVA